MSSKPIVQCLSDEVERVVDKYRGEGITFAEMVGVLELIKCDIIKEAQDDEDDFIL